MLVSARVRTALVAAAVLLPLGATRVHAQVLPTPRDQSDERMSQYRTDMLREATITLNAWRDAWAADDVRALVRLYDRKAMVQFPGDAMNQQGLAAVETALKARLPAAGRMELGLMDAEVSGDLMYIFQTYMLQPADGDTTAEPVTGTSTLVLRHDRGGWKIRAQVFLPAPAQTTATAAATPPATHEASSASGGNND
jgi:ketosteroid isomerase-like protein